MEFVLCVKIGKPCFKRSLIDNINGVKHFFQFSSGFSLANIMNLCICAWVPRVGINCVHVTDKHSQTSKWKEEEISDAPV